MNARYAAQRLPGTLREEGADADRGEIDAEDAKRSSG
jgi:hypothetical protein